MFCDHCGNKLPDGAVFCAVCGARQNSTVPGQESGSYTPPSGYQYTPPAYTPPGYVPPGYAPYTPPAPVAAGGWNQRFLSAWTNFATAPISLAMVICYTISLALSVLSLFSLSGMGYQMEAILSEAGYSSRELRQMMDVVTPVMIGSGISAMIPSILTTLGMWLLYTDARKPVGRLKTAGITIPEVLQTISLVMTSIVIGLMLLVLIIGMLASEEMGLILGVVLVLFLLFGGLLIGFLALSLATIKAVKKSMETFVPNPGPAGTMGVMCIIFGALSVLGGLSSGLAGVVGGVSTVLTGGVLLNYKNAMEELSREYYAMKHSAMN